jgi:hypothetical protein
MKPISGQEGTNFGVANLDMLNAKISVAYATAPDYMKPLLENGVGDSRGNIVKPGKSDIIIELAKTMFWAPSIANPDMMESGLAEKQAVPTSVLIHEFKKMMLATDVKTGTGKNVGNFDPSKPGAKEKALKQVNSTLDWFEDLTRRTMSVDLKRVANIPKQQQLQNGKAVFHTWYWRKPEWGKFLQPLNRRINVGYLTGAGPAIDPWWWKYL